MANSLRIVIVGGVAGGASAAARARRMNATAEITLLEKGPTVSFANCGLPYHLGGEIAQRSKLLVATPELLWTRFRVRVLAEHEVTSVDRDAKTISGIDLRQGKEFSKPYDRLILATGSEPLRPPFCEPASANLFQLWTLGDLDRILAHLRTHTCKRVVVIGAGFIGLEVVEQLHRLGLSIALVERLPQVLAPLDAEMAKLIEQELALKEIALHLGASVDQFDRANGLVTAVQLADGTRIDADLVIVGAGVRPRVELAQQAGLSIGNTGGVTVNASMQTSDPNIYAVGDMVEYMHGVTGSKQRVPLAGPANRSGRVAGTHAATGSCQPMGPVLGTAIVRVFSVTAACTGLNERTCIAQKIPYRTAIIQGGHHASYFPGASNLTLKLVYANDSGRILGAQAVGGDGVDKRIDIIATALHFGGSVHDLAQLDLAYAPPYGAAKDPVHIAAFAAENDLAGNPVLVPWDSDLSGLQLVDVRSEQETRALPLEGAINIPVDQLADRVGELDPSLPTVTVCHSGKRAHVAACRLRGQGFQSVTNLNGGMSVRSLMG